MNLTVLAVGDVVAAAGLYLLSRRTCPHCGSRWAPTLWWSTARTPPTWASAPSRPAASLERRGRRHHPGQPHLVPAGDRPLAGAGAAADPAPGQLRAAHPGPRLGGVRHRGRAGGGGQPHRPLRHGLHAGQPLPGGGAPPAAGSDETHSGGLPRGGHSRRSWPWATSSTGACRRSGARIPTSPPPTRQILPQGTGYQTDLGMTGPMQLRAGHPAGSCPSTNSAADVPARYEPAPGPVKLEGAVFTIDAQTGLCIGAERVSIHD